MKLSQGHETLVGYARVSSVGQSLDVQRQLKRDDTNVETIEHRQKYLNNRIEADHGLIKRLCRATLGFKSMKTAYVTIRASR